MEYISKSVTDTEKIAEEIAKNVKSGDSVALFGGLGMGKTAFTRGFAKGLGFMGEVSSPTFAIINEYRGGKLHIYHFDMYRIESFDDLYSTNYFEYLDMGGVVITEWSENIENALPEEYIRIEFERLSDNERKITVNYSYRNI